MIPAYYEFQNPARILSGTYALENIAKELQSFGVSRPLLLSDNVLSQIGTVKILNDALTSCDMPVAATCTDIPADSSIQVVNDIAALYRASQCDSLIALGGGSVLDTAKGVGMLISQGSADLLDLMGCEVLPRGNHVPVIAIPTTSGTGSEATMVAVINNPALRLKMEFISQYLVPDVAVLDVRMVQTMPPKITASTGMDALCHAIEASTCMQRNPLSDAYAYAAMDLIRDNLVAATRNGNDKKARISMANASLLAGCSFSNSMVGLVHAIGHALGGICRVPHGEAMSILLPLCMEYNLRKLDNEYGELLLHIKGPEVYASTPRKDRGSVSIDAVRELETQLHDLCGLPVRLRDTKARTEDFDQVARRAMDDGAMIVNPVQADHEEILEILEKAW